MKLACYPANKWDYIIMSQSVSKLGRIKEGERITTQHQPMPQNNQWLPVLRLFIVNDARSSLKKLTHSCPEQCFPLCTCSSVWLPPPTWLSESRNMHCYYYLVWCCYYYLVWFCYYYMVWYCYYWLWSSPGHGANDWMCPECGKMVSNDLVIMSLS